jgi:hypothetical protein
MIQSSDLITRCTNESDVWHAKPDPSDRNQAIISYFGQGQLRKQVLFDVNLEIFPGEIVMT